MYEPFSGTLSYWVLQTLAMALTALLIPKLRITSLFGAAGTVAALALINATLWDAALFFSVPHTLSTQAVTLFVANGVIFWILVKLLPGIEVEGVAPAIAAPVVFTVLSLLISNYGRDIDVIDVGRRAIAAVESLRDSLVEETAAVDAGEEGSAAP